MNTKLYAALDAAYPEMVEIRRHLHMNPEPSFHETETARYILSYYEKLGVDVKGNVGGNGVVATIKGAKPGKTVALRADFDALPIQDQKENIPYRSTVDGVMHACGHDGHTATLLVLGKTLFDMRDELAGTYVLIHQHAEELVPGGAKSMISAGVLDGVDAIFGTHLWSMTPFGRIDTRVGPLMAAADSFTLKVQGRGGHGASPHETIDAVVVGSQIVSNLQTLVSRRVDPLESAVLSIGSFVAQNPFNIIADQAVLSGTVRTFKEDVRSLMETEMERVIKGTSLANNSDYEFNYKRGYSAVINHENETLFVNNIAATVPGVTEVYDCPPQMGGEDFAYYLEEIPGSFFFTGAMPDGDVYPHHHPKFDFKEEAMLIAAKTLGSAAIHFNKE
ncbi:Catalyzes the cleavage of p-aminobenzoyl-glutamate to p-aminobenzoate and glutamate, subunit A [Planococcus halocryophilus Or1]|uniref:Peptidase M20 n=1 Tax=Planococcus halocryophilus TaxID=1215089 RepID=A0A1C7DLZ5_9BACL|nr:amidohydrolase [Planococcus halocryophilus]ANU12485.1 peptidase M20 [Planococcus halocryophilus]EMF48233.1 Catalyzes the cleavage of p-aminobenzoyl-glutamate to p-aminobenzoate and glutamate, subunit A [Planococcus halocryophilus Or1]